MAVKTTYGCDEPGCKSTTADPVNWYCLLQIHDHIAVMVIAPPGGIPERSFLACGLQCLTTQLYRMIDQTTQQRAQPAPKD